MQINGIYIANVESLRDNFSVPQLWKDLENGTLSAFQREVSAKDDPTGIAGEIAAILAEQHLETGIALLKNGALDPEALRARVETGTSVKKDRGKSGEKFYEEKAGAIRELTWPLRENCNPRQAWELVLFLLLNLQAGPKNGDLAGCEFFAQRLAELNAGGEPFVACEPPDGLPGPRICLCGENPILLWGGRLLRWQDGESTLKPFPGMDEPVAGFTYTDQLGLIAFGPDGALHGQVHPLPRKLAQGRKLRQVTAYLNQFAMLDSEGALIAASGAGLEDLGQWTKLREIHQGLNSLTGIQSDMGRVVQWGSSRALEDYTDVRSVDTSSRRGEPARYALLCEDGTLHMDDGHTERDVLASCLYSGGYLYVKERTIYRRAFERAEAETLPYKLTLDVEELHAGGGRIVYGGIDNGIFKMGVVKC